MKKPISKLQRDVSLTVKSRLVPVEIACRSVMNGPTQMYKTCQIIDHDLKVELPNCMYKMKNIHAKKNEGPLDDQVAPFRLTADITKQVNQYLKGLANLPEMGTLIDRQERIIRQLQQLRKEMENLKNDLTGNSITLQNIQTPKLPNIVLKASPQHPPYSLLLLRKLTCKLFNIKVSMHQHSTVKSLSENATHFVEALLAIPINPELPTYSFWLIWKNIGPSFEMVVSQTQICGESNMLRYLARLMPDVLPYETTNNTNEIDSVLDVCYSLVQAKTKTERLSLIQFISKRLGKSSFLCGQSEITIADLAASSAIKQVAPNEINQNMTKWIERCETNV